MSKRNIQYVQQSEPSFIAQFKKNAGFKAGPTVDSKNVELERDENGSDGEDEKPTVVVLKTGDLTEEEYERMKKSGGSGEDAGKDAKPNETESADNGDKIVFKKPAKRASSSELNTSSSKKVSKKRDSRKGSASAGVSNKKLLSFADDEEEEG